MKNIHLLPTDKPSGLFLSNFDKTLNLGSYPLRHYTTNQHIYITSDEEIKDGEYGICLDLVRESFKSHQAVFKMDSEQRQAMEELGGQKKAQVLKIILTTDQDLISKTCVHNFVNVLNDAFKCTKCKKEVFRSEITISDTIHGVQAIDDEFLEWFVKNPSCKEVEIKQHFIDFKTIGKYIKEYIIIIPKEEPNIVVRDSIDYGNHYHKLLDIQHEGKELSIKEVMEGRSSAYDFIDFDKQETLEEKKPYWELLDKKAEVNNTIDLDAYAIGVEDGIKWQAERRMYSEEDMKKAFIAGFTPKITTTLNDSFNKWFEQFKKK